MTPSLRAIAIAISLIGSTSLAQTPIRIGAALSATGSYSAQGNYQREGYLLCQKHVNAQGGVLGRPIEFVIYDDTSDDKTVARLYEKLIAEDKVDAVLGPYGSQLTEAAADTNEKHRRLMIAPTAGSTVIFEKGRRYLVMMLSPVESLPEGVLDLAARSGMKRVAAIKLDGLVANAHVKGTIEIAKAKGLEVVLLESYPADTQDFSALLAKVKAARPDVFVAASVRLPDLVAITKRMKDLDLNAGMLNAVPYGLLPDYYKLLGKEAEYVYSGSYWEATLPYPGNAEFVAAYEAEWKRAPVVQSAAGYAACRLLVETAGRVGSFDDEKLRAALLATKTKTVFGDFAIDQRGFQTAHKPITIQWQDGKQVVVWPEEVASGKARMPTPQWAAR